MQAKILTENSEVPSTPGWGQASSLYEDNFVGNPGGNSGSNYVDNFGKVKFPAPKVDEEAFEDWYAEPIKVAPAEKDVSKSRHDFLMSLRGPKTSEKPPIKVARFDPSQPIKVVRFDPSQNKVVQPIPVRSEPKEKAKSASDILRDLQNSGKLPQVNDQLKAQQNQSRRNNQGRESRQAPNQGGGEQEERAPRETKCRVGWSKTMEAPQEPKVKLKLENQRTRLKKAAAPKEKPQDVICFECGAEVSGKLFLQSSSNQSIRQSNNHSYHHS